MTRREALYLLLAGIAMTVGGLVWLFGPVGLIGCGIGVGVFALLVPEVKEQREPVADAAAPGRHPLVRA
jgi:hypothetical protein